ncbi:MAG: DUF2007 domain-containing protein [Pirellulales bacterium]|nr:DUF2007 domain-containing protein [Pirellulales bacterium]
MPDPNEVITIYKAKNPTAAYLIRNALQDAGIQCQVAEVNDPFPGLPLGEPDVMVRASDADRALAIIEQLDS